MLCCHVFINPTVTLTSSQSVVETIYRIAWTSESFILRMNVDCTLSNFRQRPNVSRHLSSRNGVHSIHYSNETARWLSNWGLHVLLSFYGCTVFLQSTNTCSSSGVIDSKLPKSIDCVDSTYMWQWIWIRFREEWIV